MKRFYTIKYNANHVWFQHEIWRVKLIKPDMGLTNHDL